MEKKMLSKIEAAFSQLVNIPDTNGLGLISQMFATIKVEGFDDIGSAGSEKPLGTSRWGQIFIVARILRDFDVPHTVGDRGHAHGVLAESKVQIMATVGDVKVDVETGVGTANNGHGVLVGNGECVGQTTTGVTNFFARGLRFKSIKEFAHRSRVSGGPGDGKGQKVQTDLADVFGAFAETGTAATRCGGVAGVFEVGAIL